MRSSHDFLTSSFAAETYGWEGGLQNSFGGAEQPRMIELLVYHECGGSTGPRTTRPGGHFYGGTSCPVTLLVTRVFLHTCLKPKALGLGLLLCKSLANYGHNTSSLTKVAHFTGPKTVEIRSSEGNRSHLIINFINCRQLGRRKHAWQRSTSMRHFTRVRLVGQRSRAYLII